MHLGSKLAMSWGLLVSVTYNVETLKEIFFKTKRPAAYIFSMYEFYMSWGLLVSVTYNVETLKEIFF